MVTLRVSQAADLGPALREVRLSEDVTQSALAEMSHVSRQWLNAFESGDKPSAPLDMVLRVIAVLDVTVALSHPVFTPPDPGTLADEEPVDLDALIDGGPG
jgi:transcriptional regulator with XRE-family HTH domain